MDNPNLDFLATSSPFSTAQRVRERVVTAMLAQASLNQQALNQHLRARLTSDNIENGALVAEPVIESAARYLHADERFCDLVGTLFTEQLFRAVSDAKAGKYRFAPDRKPYKHQLESWKILARPERRSIIVTSGTGSGKTECFLFALLDDLAREAEQTQSALSGIRAIVLYPLNALIASQQA